MRIRGILLLVNLLVVFGMFFSEVATKEMVLEEGKLVLFELAPRDPRSLLQGDYMQLRYSVTRGMRPEEIPSRGFLVLEIGEDGVADSVIRTVNHFPSDFGTALPIKYFYNERFVSIGAESYFFQEGTAEYYEEAKYGGVKVGPDGEGVLIGLFDEDKNLIRAIPVLDVEPMLN